MSSSILASGNINESSSLGRFQTSLYPQTSPSHCSSNIMNCVGGKLMHSHADIHGYEAVKEEAQRMVTKDASETKRSELIAKSSRVVRPLPEASDLWMGRLSGSDCESVKDNNDDSRLNNSMLKAGIQIPSSSQCNSNERVTMVRSVKNAPHHNGKVARTRSLGAVEDNQEPDNPSLCQLMTRARLERRALSAHTSPVDYHRKIVPCRNSSSFTEDTSQDLAETLDEIKSFRSLWSAEYHDRDEGKASCIDLQRKYALLVTAPSESADSSASSKVNPRLESLQDVIEETTVDLQHQLPYQGEERDLHAAHINQILDQAKTAVAQESLLEKSRTLCLPDPGEVDHRRILFAVSKEMCSRSSWASTGSSPVSNNSSCEGSLELVQQNHVDHHGEDFGEESLASYVYYSDDEDSLMSYEEDENGSLSMSRGMCPDDDTIAFSVDSINMRKRQFHCSTSENTYNAKASSHQLSQGSRSISSHSASANAKCMEDTGYSSHQSCGDAFSNESNLAGVAETPCIDPILNRRFQIHSNFQRRSQGLRNCQNRFSSSNSNGYHVLDGSNHIDCNRDEDVDDGDCSIASVSSLNTAISTRMMQLDLE